MLFSSRSPACRRPTGAVPAGTSVHFKIMLPRGWRCSAARLLLENGLTGEKPERGMFWCGKDGERAEWWECDFSPASPAPYFYRFLLSTGRGPVTLARGPRGEAVPDRTAPPWQLTAYDPAFATPQWFAGGVVYQIFPDRFHRSGEEKRGVPADRRLRGDWGGQPEWKPGSDGKVTNSDYFGGDLRGIEEKLPYLKSLGVTCLYLNPIFEAHSNHRYNTADYLKIDPLLGTEEDFRRLCAAAGRLGIRVLLDGVFNHTGSDSVYFNREGRYPGPGAYQSKESPYFPWYRFKKWPDEYESWWGFDTLPDVNGTDPGYDRFVNGPEGVVRRWLRAGAAGWRLDVADELADPFLDHLRRAAKAEKADALVLGEVWEDASNKIAYGRRRRYLLGDQLDSVMNYPFREAVLAFLAGGDAAGSMERILTVLENYPPQAVRALLNNIGTHDTERALTALAGEPARGRGRRWQSEARLTRGQRARGLALMRLASLMQYTLPGVPCVYYGDEAGLEGYRDPFNRGCFPWGREDAGLVEWYRGLGRLRAGCSCLKKGAFVPVAAEGDVMAYLRRDGNGALLCAFNRGGAPRTVTLPAEWGGAEALLGNAPDAGGHLALPPISCAACRLRYEKRELFLNF